MTTHENAGMTRATVHEVMHDTTVVKAKKTTSRMRTSGTTAKFECVNLGNIAAIARTRTAVFVSSKPLGFHGCGRGRVWDLTSHITCLKGQSGQTGNDKQEGFKLRFNSGTPCPGVLATKNQLRRTGILSATLVSCCT